MRTLFELVPFYQGGGVTAQMVRSTLATVSPVQIDCRDEEGNTLLIVAAQHGCGDLVEALLKKGANARGTNSAGVCGLHYTCYSSSLSIRAAKALLQTGGDPTAQELTYGCTPLHYAASAGSAEMCELLLANGASAVTCDYYNYSPAHYATDAGFTAVAELLEHRAWGAQSVGAVAEWTRKVDEETGLVYILNEATGESWWEADLTAAAKGEGDMANNPQIQDWLAQQKMRSELVTLFCKVDAMRLMEIDALVEAAVAAGPGAYAVLYKSLQDQYGIKQDGGSLNATAVSPKANGSALQHSTTDAEEEDCAVVTLDLTQLDDSILLNSSSGGGAPTMSVTPTGNTSEVDPSSLNGLRTVGSVRMLREPTMAILSVEAAAAKQLETLKEQNQNKLKEEEARLLSILNQQTSIVDKAQAELNALLQEVTEVELAVQTSDTQKTELEERLNDPLACKKEQENIENKISKLKGEFAGETARLLHMTDAIASVTLGREDREAKKVAAENERQERLAAVELEAERSLENIEREHKVWLETAIPAWEMEKAGLVERLQGQLAEAEKQLEELKIDSRAKIAAANAITKENTENTQKDNAECEAAKEFVRAHEAELAEAKKTEATNKSLSTALKREMDRSKVLHNQIEDIRGQCRIIARVRPLTANEKMAGHREVCMRDGKTSLAMLEEGKKAWDFDTVLQGGENITASQTELAAEFSGSSTSLVDGHNVIIIVAGSSGSGKTFSILGDPADQSGYFLAGGDEHSPKPKVKKGIPQPDSANLGPTLATTKPSCGIAPRLLRDAFQLLSDRDALSSYTVSISAVAVPAKGCKEPLRLLPISTESTDTTSTAGPQVVDSDDSLWSGSKVVTTPESAMEVLSGAYSTAVRGVPPQTPYHMVFRIRCSSVNRCTGEGDTGTLFLCELAEESENTRWSQNITKVLRQHAAASIVTGDGEEDSAPKSDADHTDSGVMVANLLKGCFADTAKLSTLLCLSPSEMQLSATHKTLAFGEACKAVGDGGEAALKELKKELARLKKEGKGGKPKALPRPPGGGGPPRD